MDKPTKQQDQERGERIKNISSLLVKSESEKNLTYLIHAVRLLAIDAFGEDAIREGDK